MLAGLFRSAEVLAYNLESEEFLPFQVTTRRRRKYNIEETARSMPLKAFVFDILYKDGTPLIDRPLVERMKILEETIGADDILMLTANHIVSDAQTLSLLFEEAISSGLEGIVVKKLASPYEAGARNFNWVKLKRHSSGALHDTIDCVILGYIFGRGRRATLGAGALLVGVYDARQDIFVTISKIGTGLSDEEWRSIRQRTKGLVVDHKPARVSSLIEPSVWLEPEIVIEVLADEITRSPVHTAGKTGAGPGYALRFPRLIAFRDEDKKPEDATRVEEIIEMYENQGKK
jgi:DNA ligase 1